MQNSSRHTLVSVVGTVTMVVMTVLLAAWFPAQQAQAVPGHAAIATMSSGG